jgi:hypothetical protein
VWSSNTVERTWQVKILQQGASQPEEQKMEVVRVKQLAGIEDASMRKAVSIYLPAPNNTSAMEDASSSLTLGHLILVLRWCHQQSLLLPENESERGFKIKDSVRRIAEQTVALLGAEFVMHDEIGSRVNMPEKEQSRLDAQIFELFADESILSTADNVENTAPAAYAKEGRMKAIIDRSAWDAVRPQIREGVERAWKEIQDKERRRREKRSLSGDSNWFSGIRRKGGAQKSAFRGLG